MQEGRDFFIILTLNQMFGGVVSEKDRGGPKIWAVLAGRSRSGGNGSTKSWGGREGVFHEGSGCCPNTLSSMWFSKKTKRRVDKNCFIEA